MSAPVAPSPCSLQCLAEAEPLAGSAGDATTWIGLSWPKPRWHRSTIAQSPGLPEAWSQLEREAKELGQKLSLRLFQRTPASSIEHVELVLARAGEGFKLYDVPIERAASIARAYLRSEALEWPARPLGAELFVCTDGKHDACCARAGRPLFKRLLQVRAETGYKVEISESSHLGGHRFAANCLALPQGYLYGRVQLEDARELLHLTAEGGCLHDRLRGTLGRPELEQASEAFAVSRGLGARGIHVLGARVEGDQAWVDLDVHGHGTVCVRCEARHFHSPPSCGSPPEIAGRRRWIPVSLDESRTSNAR